MFKDLFAYIKLCVESNVLTAIIPLLFVVLLFIGCKFCKKSEWNDDYLSLRQTQVIRGFCAIGIILHHCSQRTAASWLPNAFIIHCLDFFVDIGYLFVAVFLFFSGYGLYKSYKNKDDYFKHYFLKRYVPVLLALFTTDAIYLLYKPIRSNYTWYVYAIILCYTLFFIGFKLIKNEHISLLIVLLGLVGYSVYCALKELGGWWFNVVGLFYIGLVFAKYEKSIVKVLKKAYIPLFIIAIIVIFVCRYCGLRYEGLTYAVYEKSLYDLYSTLVILFRFAAGIGFTLLMLLISLKVKLNNKVLLFYESISLEFYLIQGLFANMFSFLYFDTVKPLYYIKNVPLFTIVVIACSTISGFILHFINKKISTSLLKLAVKKDA